VFTISVFLALLFPYFSQRQQRRQRQQQQWRQWQRSFGLRVFALGHSISKISCSGKIQQQQQQ
jgi:hypothetical protein